MLNPTPWLAAVLAATHLGAQPQLVVPTRAPTPATCMAKPEKPSPASTEARAFLRTRVANRTLNKAIKTVAKRLHWHDDLDAALGAADNQTKPVLWIHALGTLTGYT